MTVYATDSFTTGSDVALTAHASADGRAWALAEGATSPVVLAAYAGASGVLAAPGGINSTARINYQIPGPDQVISGRLIYNNSGVDAQISVCVRMSADVSSVYYAGYHSGQGAWFINKKTPSTHIRVATYNVGFGANGTHADFEFSAIGDNPVQLQLSLGGAVVAWYDDSATDRITAAGYAGVSVYSGGFPAAGFDSLTVSAAVVPDTVNPTMSGTISVLAVADDSISIGWSAGADDVGVEGYEVSKNGGSSWTDIGDALSRTFNSLTAGTPYPLRVRCYDAAGNKSNVLSRTVSTTDSVNPALPGMISLIAVTDTAITIGWPTGTDNVAVTDYDVSCDGGASWTDVNLVNQHTFTGLTGGTPYDLRVRARDAAGNHSAPLVLQVTTTDTVAPTWPGTIDVTDITAFGFKLAWQMASDAHFNRFGLRLDDEPWQNLGTVLETTVTGRTPSTTVTVRMRAFDDSGNYTEHVITVPLPAPPDSEGPVLAGPLTYRSLTPYGCTLDWPADADEPVVEWRVSVDGGLNYASTGTVRTRVVSGFQPGDTIAARVQGRDAAGNWGPALTRAIVLPVVSTSGAIDLSLLPAPDVIEQLDYEATLTALQADATGRLPALADVIGLESEPVNVVLETLAYQDLTMRARVNDAARASMLAYATGADLDHIAAEHGVTRLVLSAATDTDPAVLESDERLRERTQLSRHGYAVAGPRSAYRFLALTASGRVADASVTNAPGGVVVISVLATDNNGTPDPALLQLVEGFMSAEERRPLGDLPQAQAVTLIDYTVSAQLYTGSGPASAPVRAAAVAAVQAYVTARKRIGRMVSRSALIAALHQPGVDNVVLASPAADIVVGPTECARCTLIDVPGA